MARLAVVGGSPASSLPPAFGLLSHTLVDHADVDEVGGLDEDIVLVDARQDLAAARDTCRRLQARAVQLPLLLLVDAQALPVLSHEWGIGDFVLEAAQPGEIDARIRLLAAGGESSSVIRCGPVTIDESAYTATVGEQHLELTYTEFELLKYLAMHPGRVLTREHLLSEVWGYDYYGGTRTVDVHIRRLRAKLGSEYDGHITTVRNVGYRFSATR